MSERLLYLLGKSSSRDTKNDLVYLVGPIGAIGIHLDEEAAETLFMSFIDMRVMANIKFLKGETEEPGDIRIDFFEAFIKSKKKLVLTDSEIEEYIKGVEVL